jgi:hypothetical protein
MLSATSVRADVVPLSEPCPTEKGRGSINHKVKSWPPLFEATRLGLKTHELRRMTDRDYQVGDTLTLQEFDPDSQCYSGREQMVMITYVTSAKTPCALSESSLDPEYCILSIVRV